MTVDPLWQRGRRSAGNPDVRFGKGWVLARGWRCLQAAALALALGSAVSAAHAAQRVLPEVYVISNGWHTEIGLSARSLDGPLAAFRHKFPDASYFVFGWGERTFYMSPSPSWTEALRALLPARAVLLVLALDSVPTHAFVHGIRVAAVPIAVAGTRRLDAFVWRSFARSPAGALERLGPGPYPASAFYAAAGTYDGGHTCNTWTAQGLGQAGLPVRAVGVVFAGQVMRQVRALGTDRMVAGIERQGR
ncbi:MAG: DUF2459 domain-containing protein [Acetobacteraceae bacterium]